jgi:tetratricopeptide (TPR) repeat protein
VLRLWRLLLILSCALLAWRAVALGLAAHYAEQLARGDDGRIADVLAWQPGHPLGLYRLGVQQAASDPARAEEPLARAHRANPADARPLMALAALAQAGGDAVRADTLMAAADGLDPSNPSIQIRLAAYWAGRGDAERALRHLSRTLAADPARGPALFPALVRLAQSATSRGLLAPYALSPPSWWQAFFIDAAREADELDAVRFLYELRRGAADAPLTRPERDAFVRRLQRDGLASEAYLVWVGGLSARERAHLGLLFDGSFELPLSNAPFGWQMAASERVDARPLAIPGGTGSRALRLRFRALEDRFWQLSQPLLLPPGDYRLTGQVRGVDLDTAGGLRWLLSCRQPRPRQLAVSESFRDARDWTRFGLDFQVPRGCRLQELRLVSAGRRPFELRISGDLWLDDLKISRTDRDSGGP